MIRETIDAINANILTQMGDGQRSGVVMPYHNQQEKATALKHLDSGTQLTLDDKPAYQTAHLLQRMEPAGQNLFGSFHESSYSVSMVLILATRKFSDLMRAEQAVKLTERCQTGAIDLDTLSVLRRYWQVRADSGKNYDPALLAFAIAYKIEGVSDEDMRLYLQTLPTTSPL